MLDDLQAPTDWVANTSKYGEWMQIDTGIPIKILGIITQGRGSIFLEEWVSLFKVEYRLVNDLRFTIELPGTFSMTNGLKKEHLFVTPINACYMRIVVLAWNSTISMRASLVVTSCSLCLSNADSLQGSISEMACMCPRGTYKYTSETNYRALSLVPGCAQLSTLADRMLHTYAATAQFNITTGTVGGKGAVTFDRQASQYIDGGPYTSMIATNGGFTAVSVVKFTGVPGRYERIYGFGSEIPVNHFSLRRQSWSDTLGFQMSSDTYDCRVYSAPLAIIQDNWLTIRVKYTSSNKTLRLSVGINTSSVECTTPQNDVILNHTYAGKSIFGHDACFKGTIAGLYAVDTALSEAEIEQVVAEMYASNDILQTCTGCPTGTYGTEEGKQSVASCQKCHRGKYNECVGANSRDMCISCENGKYHKKLGASTRNECKECSCRKYCPRMD